MYRLVFHPKAQKEYYEAIDWYNEQLEGLGYDFAINVGETLKLIHNKPLLFPITKGTYREVPVDVFPYTILYIVRPRLNQVYISAVFHTSRNPGSNSENPYKHLPYLTSNISILLS